MIPVRKVGWDVHEVLVNRLGSLSRNTMVRLIIEQLYMTIVVDWDVKPQINQPTNPDQTAPDQGLYYLPFHLNLLDALLNCKHIVKIFGWLLQMVWVSEFLLYLACTV